MVEYIIYGAILLVCLGIFVAISVAKAKIGWSWIDFDKKEED